MAKKTTRKELEERKELARFYYMRGDTQTDIAEKLGVSRVTVGGWVKDGGWDIKRMAKSITKKELITQMMVNASEKLERKEMSYDEMSKLAATIEKLDKKTNIVTVIDVFSFYSNWMIERSGIDKELTPDILKTINRFQDIFINELLKGTKLDF